MTDRTPSLREGLGVDSKGNPSVDPSENVKALSEAANKRQDDLRQAQDVLTNEKITRIDTLLQRYDRAMLAEVAHTREIGTLRAAHVSEVGALREGFQEKVARAESGRLDSIRQVDREEVAKTAMAANTAITTLAKQTSDLAVTLAKAVTDTATAAENRNSAQYGDTNKRLSALELSSSEGKGKQTVADPQMVQLLDEVRRLASLQLMSSGKGEGGKAMWGYVAAGFGFLMTLLSIAMTVLLLIKR